MTVTLSLLAGAGWQFFDDNGVPLSGGKLYTYAAGTTTPAATYTNSTGNTPNANPIVLDSAGRVADEVWLTYNAAYKFVLKTAQDVEIWSKDDIGSVDAATTLAADLANTSNVAKGDALVGFRQSTSAGAYAAAVGRTVHDKLQEVVSVKDFGALTDGTDAATAFNNANAASAIFIPSGTYSIKSNVTFTSPVTLQGGAILDISSGITVTFNSSATMQGGSRLKIANLSAVAFNKSFDAGVYRVFECTGTGAVTFNWQFLSTGYPEWWGAAADGATDSYAGITACLLACQITQLQNGDYFVSDTILMDKPHRTLAGRGSQYEDTASEVTRLLVTSDSKHTLIVGPAVQPASINLFNKQNVVRDIYVARTVAPLISSACTAVFVRYTLYTQLVNVKTDTSIYGFQFYGTVALTATGCFSARAIAGAGGGTDKWYGYYINGNASIGAAGGNASIYLNYCSAACNIGSLSSGNGFGFYADGAFTDMFLESPETVNCNIGIYVLGDGSSGTVATNTDCQIKNPINDAFYQFGIFIKNVNKYGSVSVSGGYYGVNAAATSALYVLDSLGSVQVSGGQFIMFPSTTAKGIVAEGSNGLIVDGAQILESSTAGVVLSNCSSCDIRPLVKNYSVTLANAGVQMVNTCAANNIAPVVYGGASKVALGVQLVGALNARNEINCTGINSACLAASADKLQINGVQITTTGLSGSNLVSGVMT